MIGVGREKTFRSGFGRFSGSWAPLWARGTRCLDGVEREPLTPASLKAGGETYLYPAIEDHHLVQQRGGWNDQRVMGVYFQELATSTFLA